MGDLGGGAALCSLLYVPPRRSDCLCLGALAGVMERMLRLDPALESAGLQVVEQREGLVQRLNQVEPGQLGKISRKRAEVWLKEQA
ncbi:MAG: hypothetical protein WAK56_18740 [Candidatus Sulfotelmatobacter sp.]